MAICFKRMTHGRTHSFEYKSWSAMLNRVRSFNRPDSHLYAGRGIDVDPRWEKFENFLADMGPRQEHMSLDRIDPDRGYWPDNCRWATAKQQSRNRRDFPRYTMNGKTLTMMEWCEELGLNIHTVRKRRKATSDPKLLFAPTNLSKSRKMSNVYG